MTYEFMSKINTYLFITIFFLELLTKFNLRHLRLIFLCDRYTRGTWQNRTL